MKCIIYLTIITLICIVCNTLGAEALTMDNLRTITSQYTHLPDWIRTSNFTGENITADYCECNGSLLTDLNSSNFWDNLDDPSDINSADITDDNTYFKTIGDTIIGNGKTYYRDINAFIYSSASGTMKIKATNIISLWINEITKLYLDATGGILYGNLSVSEFFKGNGSMLTDLNRSVIVSELNTNRTEGNVDFTYNISADYFKGNVDWTNLTGYPVACPAPTAVTQLGDSITCTSYQTGNTTTEINAVESDPLFDAKILANRSANVSFYENIGVDTGSCIKVEGTCEMDFITGRLDIPNRIRSLVRFDAFGQWNLYNNVVMYFREAAAIVAVLRHHTAFDQMTFGVTHRSDHQLILTTYDNTILNHDRPDRDDPWFYVFSNTSVDVDNSQWLGFAHNKSDGIIESGKGSIYLRNNTIGAGNITSKNVFIPQDIFSHTNRTIQVLGANTWTNVTFDQEVAEIKFGIIHNADDDTNQTFTVSMDGVYFGDYDFDIEDNSVSASDIDIAGRLIYINGTEVVGSDFEAGIEKNGVEKELSHNFLFNARAGDSFIFQFVGSDADIQISTHGTFGDHPESASVIIKKERNL